MIGRFQIHERVTSDPYQTLVCDEAVAVSLQDYHGVFSPCSGKTSIQVNGSYSMYVMVLFACTNLQWVVFPAT